MMTSVVTDVRDYYYYVRDNIYDNNFNEDCNR